MMTIKGKDVFKKGYKTFQASGTVVIYLLAAKSELKIKNKYPNLEVDPISTDENYEYQIIE